jgi:hypothetical protein
MTLLCLPVCLNRHTMTLGCVSSPSPSHLLRTTFLLLRLHPPSLQSQPHYELFACVTCMTCIVPLVLTAVRGLVLTTCRSATVRRLVPTTCSSSQRDVSNEVVLIKAAMSRAPRITTMTKGSACPRKKCQQIYRKYYSMILQFIEILDSAVAGR